MQFDYFAASLGSSRLSCVVPWTGQFISAAYSFIYLTGCRSIRPPWPLVIQAMAVLNYWVALDGGWWAALFILSSLTVSICSPFFWGVLGAMLRPDATLAGLLFICKWDKKRTKMNKTIITQFPLFLSTHTRPTKYKFSWGLNYERNGPPTCSAPDVRIHVEQQLYDLLVCPARELSPPGAYTAKELITIFYLFLCYGIHCTNHSTNWHFLCATISGCISNS